MSQPIFLVFGSSALITLKLSFAFFMVYTGAYLTLRSFLYLLYKKPEDEKTPSYKRQAASFIAGIVILVMYTHNVIKILGKLFVLTPQ